MRSFFLIGVKLIFKYIFVVFFISLSCTAKQPDAMFDNWSVDCDDGSVRLEDYIDQNNFTRIIIYSDKTSTFKIMQNRLEPRSDFYKNSVKINDRMIKLEKIDVLNLSPDFEMDYFSDYRNGKPAFGHYEEIKSSYLSSSVSGSFLTVVGQKVFFDELSSNDFAFFYNRKIKSKGLLSAWKYLHMCKPI